MVQRYLIRPPKKSKEVKEERTFSRDIGFLVRHKKWGWDVPATDIDFLLYDKRKAVALIEYKRGEPCIVDNASIDALIDLGNRAKLPVFITFYTWDYHYYYVRELNSFASGKAPEGRLTEYKYVEFLYWLTGHEIPQDKAEGLWNSDWIFGK